MLTGHYKDNHNQLFLSHFISAFISSITPKNQGAIFQPTFDITSSRDLRPEKGNPRRSLVFSDSFTAQNKIVQLDLPATSVQFQNVNTNSTLVFLLPSPYTLLKKYSQALNFTNSWHVLSHELSADAHFQLWPAFEALRLARARHSHVDPRGLDGVTLSHPNQHPQPSIVHWKQKRTKNTILFLNLSSNFPKQNFSNLFYCQSNNLRCVIHEALGSCVGPSGHIKFAEYCRTELGTKKVKIVPWTLISWDRWSRNLVSCSTLPAASYARPTREVDIN